MEDFGRQIISCGKPEELFSAAGEVMKHCPQEVRSKFLRIWGHYLHYFGLNGVFERLNNRSVEAIVADFENAAKPPVIASGEMDGIRYTLYDAPPIGQYGGKRATEADP